jgi:bacterioferritin-associated ferredoxin
MLVCLCKGVSDKTVRWLVQNGSGCVKDVMSKCRAGTDCGTCVSHLKALVETTKAEAAQSNEQATAANE